MLVRRIVAVASLTALAVLVPTAAEAAPRKATADVAVTLQDQADPVAVGTDIAYTAVVTNGGSADASNVHFTLAFGGSSKLVSAGADSQWGYCEDYYGEALCQLGPLARGGVTTVTVHFQPYDAGTFTATATANSDTPDDATANNTATTTTTVTDAPRVATQTAPAASWMTPCTGCFGGVIGGVMTVSFRTEVLALDGSLVNEGYVQFAACSAPVVNGVAACSYNGLSVKPSSAASYSGSARYAPSSAL